MKAYTDISQSKKLAEILPHKTADNTWERVTIAGSNLNVPEEQQYVHNGNMPFCFYSGIGVPCWSLAALLELIPCADIVKLDTTWTCGSILDRCEADNPIDACYEMIIKLHEQNLL